MKSLNPTQFIVITISSQGIPQLITTTDEQKLAEIFDGQFKIFHLVYQGFIISSCTVESSY